MNRLGLVLRNTDVLAGLVFIATAGIFAYGSSRLQIGTTLRMGPGYFPMVLAGLLALFGGITVLSGLRRLLAEHEIAKLHWGGLVIIIGAVLFFTFGLPLLGFPLTVFGTTIIAVRASSEFRLVPALILAAVVALVAWIAFRELLGLPFQALGSWLTFG